MLQSNDLVLLLTSMASQGIEGASEQIRKCIGKPVSLETLRFINEHRQLDVAKFYERVRKNHNEKRSSLYKNLVRDDLSAEDAITTLHAFALQAALFSKHVEEGRKPMFFKHVRAEEVASVLEGYYKDYDLSSAMRVLRLIKADIMAFESVGGRRDEEGNVI